VHDGPQIGREAVVALFVHHQAERDGVRVELERIANFAGEPRNPGSLVGHGRCVNGAARERSADLERHHRYGNCAERIERGRNHTTGVADALALQILERAQRHAGMNRHRRIGGEEQNLDACMLGR
jgi:hypothetical protein